MVTGQNLPEKNPPGKNPPEKIALKAVESELVPTRVLNPNASEASYKPKQRSYRKMKLIFYFRGDFFRGDFYLEPWYSTIDPFRDRDCMALVCLDGTHLRIWKLAV